MTILSILLQEAQQGTSAFSSIFMIIALIAIFYFFMIRPQTKRQKEIRQFREKLQNGDKVVTAGGIYGKIKDIKPDSNVVILEIADNVRIRIDKSSIYATAQDANDTKLRQSTVNGNTIRSTSFWISLASLITSIAVLIVK